MRMKDMAALGAVSGILIQAWATPIASAGAAAPAEPSQLIVELAGADESDKAKPEQLKKANQNMVPAEGMRKAEPRSEPSMPMKSAGDADKMPAKAMPAAATKPMPKKFGNVDDDLYIRADVGYTFPVDPDGTTSAGAMTSVSVNNAPYIGFGIGYRFNTNARADVTVDYRSDADVSATLAGGTAVTTKVSGWTVMFNGYWDIDKFGAVTPYVGAGVGVGRLQTTNQSGGNAENGADTNSLAWAGMLGLAIDTGMAGTMFDLGYRFISLGKFKQESGGANYDAMTAHEVHAGLRFAF
jgi:opacity protein-like surface antigen